jgi:serine/threonine protein phosphatase Stp1
MATALQFRSASATHAGCVRTENQDAVLAVDRRGLWAVSDGVGGLAYGEMASAAVIESLCGGGDAERSWVRTRLQKANHEINGLGTKAAPQFGMAATAAVLGASGDRYFCLWAGDCRIYRLHRHGIAQLTHDHRYVQELIDNGLLDAAAARTHPQRNVVTRAVGARQALALDECEGPVASGDVFVLATDGVTGVLEDKEIEKICRQDDLAGAVEEIVERCLARMASDNLSVIVVRADAAVLGSSPEDKPPAASRGRKSTSASHFVLGTSRRSASLRSVPRGGGGSRRVARAGGKSTRSRGLRQEFDEDQLGIAGVEIVDPAARPIAALFQKRAHRHVRLVGRGEQPIAADRVLDGPQDRGPDALAAFVPFHIQELDELAREEFVAEYPVTRR